MTSTDHPPLLNPSRGTSIANAVSTSFRSVPVTFNVDPDTAKRLTALAHQAQTDVSWYLWKLISEAYIDYILVNESEP